MMFLTSLSRVFGICLLSLLLSLLPTPAVGRQLSSITNGVHRSQCNLNQPSKHPAIEGRSLTPRDCAPDEGEDHVIPQDYWSFYPYTTAIRSLGEHEHKFFGPLGYHTRNAEQRATDQTYLWFIPKRTTTVDATQTIHKAALTETVYITKTKTTTVTRMFRETITVARRTVTVTVYDRPYLTRGAVIPWGHLFTARHSAESRSRRQPKVHHKPVDSTEVERVEKEILIIPEDIVNPTILLEELHQPVIPSVILGVAQIAGFILVGILLAAMIVLLFVWCSQPLWWPCALKRQMAKTAMKAKMLGAQVTPDENLPDSITPPVNTECVNTQLTPRAVADVAVISTPDAVDGAMSEVSTYPTFPYPVATSTGSQSILSHGNSMRRTVSGGSLDEPTRGMPGRYHDLGTLFDESSRPALPR